MVSDLLAAPLFHGLGSRNLSCWETQSYLLMAFTRYANSKSLSSHEHVDNVLTALAEPQA